MFKETVEIGAALFGADGDNVGSIVVGNNPVGFAWLYGDGDEVGARV